ncbi:CDP-alcohol phosphatidyltransferase [compost metagenome]
MRPGWVRAREEGSALTRQQQLAERTNGVVRLPNLMTAAGVGLTILAAHYARQGQFMAAAVTTGASFAMDMEGSVARKCKVEDPVRGAKTDQFADAAKAVIVGGVLLSRDIMPKSAAVLTYGPKAIGAAAGIAAKAAGNTELASSKIGKAAEVCRDIVPVAFLAETAGKKLDTVWLEKAGNRIAWGAVSGAAIIGTVAAVGYMREAAAARKSADLSAHQGEILDYVEN